MRLQAHDARACVVEGGALVAAGLDTALVLDVDHALRLVLRAEDAALLAREVEVGHARAPGPLALAVLCEHCTRQLHPGLLGGLLGGLYRGLLGRCPQSEVLSQDPGLASISMKFVRLAVSHPSARRDVEREHSFTQAKGKMRAEIVSVHAAHIMPPARAQDFPVGDWLASQCTSATESWL